MKVEEIISPSASPALGPYCHGRKCGNVIVTSGQIPLKADGTYVLGVAEATKLVLENLIGIVEAGGGAKDTVAKVDVFLRDLNDFDEMNEAYAAFFGDYKPARVCVQAGALPHDVPLEAAMLAFTAD